MAKIIGIDLGTTNSVVAIMEGDQPKVLINSAGSRITLGRRVHRKGEVLVGQVAKQQVTNPGTVFSIKRLMGRRYERGGPEEKTVPYEVHGGPEDFVKVEAAARNTPEQVSAFILQDLKKTAESYLGETVEQAVITVPAYFNDAQRKATKDAGEIMSLKVLRVLPEHRRRAWRTGWTRRRTRRSSCSTSAAARSTCRASTSATASSRCCRSTATPPRRRRLRRGTHQLRRRGVPQAGGHRPPQGPDGPAALKEACRRGRERCCPTRWRARSTWSSPRQPGLAPAAPRSPARGSSS